MNGTDHRTCTVCGAMFPVAYLARDCEHRHTREEATS